MIDKLRSMAVFARVAEFGSFRRAAERLGLSASVVSHHVTHLETQLGTQLLYRSTRHVALTDEGRRFYDSCCIMLAAAESALAGLHSQSEQLSGRLWVTAPAIFSHGPFTQDVAEFCNLYPQVDVHLEFDDAPRNLIQEGIDVAIRLGPEDNASLTCREMFVRRPGLYAAPAYLERYGPINDLDALLRADWICHTQVTEITLESPDGRIVPIRPTPRLRVNSAVSLHEFVRSGLGVAQLPGMLSTRDLSAGRLVTILPEWRSGEIGCYVIFPAKAPPRSPAVQFADFLATQIKTHTLARAQQDAAPP